MLVGASLVVDYFAFELENLANSALHRVSGRSVSAVVPRPVDPRPVDDASNEEHVVERFSCCNT